MELTYSRYGDYLLPNIILKDPPPELVEPLGRYGRMRRSFLEEHRQIQYSILVLTEQLFPHLRQVDATARERLNAIMSDILVFQPPPDKATDGIAWAAHMETVKRTAEKMMLDEVVYTY
jgi:hypothetical protein